MNEDQRSVLNRVIAPFVEIFGLSRALAISIVLLIAAVIVFSLFWFFHSAPPNEITITGGAPGSSFETNAIRYREILARNGVTLNVLPSEGSLQNLQRLQDSSLKVDIGFVQGGVSNGPPHIKLVSLGSISYQPLLVLYSGSRITFVSDLRGKRLAIGPVGSGTRSLALTLLKLNDIEAGNGTLFESAEAKEAAEELLDGSVDAIFLMGDSASPKLMKQLLLTPGIELMDFSQAEAYSRRISYLNELNLPAGSLDFAKNLPAHNVSLISPTVELLVRPNLHPALCDLLIEAAQEVHGTPGLFKKKNEFPAPLEHDYPISTEAIRYYKSGKRFLYTLLPFRLASLVNRILVAFVPAVVLLIPAVRVVPPLLRLRIRLRLYRWYRALLAVERDLRTWPPERRQELIERLNHIEQAVNKMKVPPSFADQFYTLRQSIQFVLERVAEDSARK